MACRKLAVLTMTTFCFLICGKGDEGKRRSEDNYSRKALIVDSNTCTANSEFFLILASKFHFKVSKNSFTAVYEVI